MLTFVKMKSFCVLMFILSVSSIHIHGDMKDEPIPDNPEWERIQQNTFTRWCNEHLKSVNVYIYDLENDLGDGVKLIALLQVLSHKKVPRYVKKPTFRLQKIQNIDIALKFMEDEQIKLPHIDAADIVKGNLKLILGMIWSLILKYQVPLPMTENDKISNGSPKQALMGWVKSKLPPEVPMKNFNKDWNDGIAIAALVDAIAPGLFPYWDDLNAVNKVDNARKAMNLAEEWLGVPQVITPDEITNPDVDELSVMTYVSYFPKAKLKPVAPLKQRVTTASQSSAYGTGIEQVVVNIPAQFTVVKPISSKGTLSVQVFGPGPQQIDSVIIDNHNDTYQVQYTPPKEGVYEVIVRIDGHHIPKSPFRVTATSDVDISKVIAEGPGIEPQGVLVGRPALFMVSAPDAGSGDFAINVIDPNGSKKTELKVEDIGNHMFLYMYMPLIVGRYVIVIKFGGKEVAKSPYYVDVAPASERVKIYGNGLEPGLKTGKPVTFTIDTTDAGPGVLDVKIAGPGKSDVKADVKDNGDGTFTCTFKPTKPGQYRISVKFDDFLVPQSPTVVVVQSSTDLTNMIAWGPGLERGVVGKPAKFYVNCTNSVYDLTIDVEGPGDVKVELFHNGDHTMIVTYYPVKPGKYLIHVRYQHKDIEGSPFQAKINPHGDISTVYAEGTGLSLNGNTAEKTCEFTVYAQEAGVETASIQLVVKTNGENVASKVKDNGDGTFWCIYFPEVPGLYTVSIYFMDEEIPMSPFAVTINPPVMVLK